MVQKEKGNKTVKRTFTTQPSGEPEESPLSAHLCLSDLHSTFCCQISIFWLNKSQNNEKKIYTQNNTQDYRL